MLTSTATKAIQHPTEIGVEFTIRRLSHYQVMMARDRRMDALASTLRMMQGITLPERSDTAEPAQGADLDRMTVLEAGVVGWSYPVNVDAETLRDLDEPTAAWAFQEIVDYSLRSADERKA